MTAIIADTSSDVVDGSDADKAHLIHGSSPIYQIGIPTEKWIKENKITNLAIITVDGIWGVAHTTAWTKAAENTGTKIAMKEMYTYTDEATILSTLVVKAKANKVNGIVWTGTEAGAITLVKKMQELNYNVPVLGTNYLKVALDEKKIESKGMNLNMIESARSDEFNKKYEQTFGKIPNKYAESSYDLTMIAAQAEIAKGTMNTRDYIVSKEHKGFAKNYTFDQKGDVTNLYWTVTSLK
jgi:ABC-type branched-subunit amino acid transport system substrate-binding protein